MRGHRRYDHGLDARGTRQGGGAAGRADPLGHGAGRGQDVLETLPSPEPLPDPEPSTEIIR